MSLILNNDSSPQWTIHADSPVEDMRDSAMLDRYLAIMEANRQSCRFVPDDALLALDMAGFVRGQLAGGKKPPVSTARLALALVNHPQQTPVQ